MYTYVAPISVFWDAFFRLTEQVLAVPEGYREDELGACRRSVSADRFHLQVFFGREQRLLSSCASNVHKSGPPCGPTRGTYSIQAALLGFEPIRCNYPGLGRPKSTQVDLSRPKSTEFLFFRTFLLDFADGYSSRFRQPHEVCFNSLQLPWVRAGCDGLCRCVSFLSALTSVSSQMLPRRL